MTNATKGKLLLSTMLMGCIGFTAQAQIVTNDGTAILDSDTEAVELREQELLENIASGDDVDDIIVTGTRTRRPDLATAFPTLVVGQDTLQENAFINVADALTEVPGFGVGIDPVGDQGANVGVNFVDFYDIGSQRTLTLINGRRAVASNIIRAGGGSGSQVDLNNIPTALIERVETVGVGGAPTYGSNAIAGTVNLILRDDFEGVSASAQYGNTEEGDAEEEQYSVLVGANTDDGRGNVTFVVEYSDTNGLIQTDRPDIFVDEPFLSEVPAGTAAFNDIDVDGDGMPDSVFRLFNADGGAGQNVQLFTPGGIVSGGRLVLPSLGLGLFDGQVFGFGPDGNLGPLAGGPGQAIPGTSAFFAQGGFQNDFFGAVDQIVSPVERLNIGSTFRYDLASNLRFKGDFQYSNNVAAELVEQGGFQTFAFDGDFNDDIGGALQIPVSNPFLDGQPRNVLTNTLGFAADDTFFFSRFNNDLLGSGRREAESSFWRIGAGFEGDFELGNREFYYNVGGTIGQSDAETQTTLLNDIRFLNAIEAVRLTQDDVDTINANVAAGTARVGGLPGQVGDIVCQVTRDFARGDVPLDQIRGIGVGSGVTSADPANDVVNCVPLNIFGEGAGSAAAVDYVSGRGIFTNDLEQEVFTASIGGDVISLPGGDVQFVAGYETRSESIFFATSGDVEAGLGRSAAQSDAEGSLRTDEFFGELFVPIISPELEIPFASRLEIGGQIREIDSNVTDGFTAWTAEATYAPVEDLTFRGNITRSLREPSLIELFGPTQNAFSFADDPCDARFIDETDAAANRAANCAAIGLAPDFTSNVVNASAQGRTGANPSLTNEEADAWTVGAVLQPRWIPGLVLQADYINIEIDDLITTLTLEDNLEGCFDADPANFPNNFCSSFTRDSEGQIIDFTSGQQNAESAEYQFLQFRADYDFEVVDVFNLLGNDTLADYGEFSIDFAAFHAIERNVLNSTGVPDDNIIGGFFSPRWEGTTDFTYRNDGLRLFWRTRWQDRSLFSPSGNNFFFDDNDEEVRSLSGNFLHNASVSYDLSEMLDDYDKPLVVQFNVDNIFDDQPSGLRRAFNDFYTAEQLGRSYSFTVRANF